MLSPLSFVLTSSLTGCKRKLKCELGCVSINPRLDDRGEETHLARLRRQQVEALVLVDFHVLNRNLDGDLLHPSALEEERLDDARDDAHGIRRSRVALHRVRLA